MVFEHTPVIPNETPSVGALNSQSEKNCDFRQKLSFILEPVWDSPITNTKSQVAHWSVRVGSMTFYGTSRGFIRRDVRCQFSLQDLLRSYDLTKSGKVAEKRTCFSVITIYIPTYGANTSVPKIFGTPICEKRFDLEPRDKHTWGRSVLPLVSQVHRRKKPGTGASPNNLVGDNVPNVHGE